MTGVQGIMSDDGAARRAFSSQAGRTVAFVQLEATKEGRA